MMNSDTEKFVARSKFSVKNLGAIKSGEFTVKPLTLFCGPNNTGKTWLMYALYAFWRQILVPTLHNTAEIMKELKDNGTCQLDIREVTGSHTGKYIRARGLTRPEEFSDVFNADESIFKHSRFVWEIDDNVFVQSIIEKDFQLKINETLHLKKDAGSPYATITLISKEIVVKEMIEYEIPLVVSRLFFNTPRPFLMPAERNGLHLFFRELSTKRTALLHHASKEKIDLNDLFRDVMKSRYAQPIADYIDWLNNLSELRKRKNGPFHAIAEKVRSNVSNGRYMINHEGDISFRPNKLNRDRNEPPPENMGLHTTSSTVKSFFGLWSYLHNQAKPGDVLMIDEPELHLHPHHQQELARILAELVNGGLRIIVSTHSDYLIREINSLIMLSTENPKRSALMEKYEYEKEQLLNKEQVAAYLVNERIVKEMEITSDEGIIATTFDDVINDLNESSNDIYYTYKESENLEREENKSIGGGESVAG